jgi:2-aminoadipate transaminase
MTLALEAPQLISLAAGFVDYDTLPVEATRQVLRELLDDREAAQKALQYGTTEGLQSLRRRVADYVCALDGLDGEVRGVTADSVILGTGSQQLLYLLSEVLLDPGDLVLLGHPSYFVYMGALRSAGADCRSVPLDDNGMRSDLLEGLFNELQAKGQLSRVKLVYLVSYFQNPTGISVAGERRREILDLVEKYSLENPIHVVEDAAYRELRYDGEDIPSFFALDETRHTVLYLGTFSKPFAPGLKTGFAVLPPELAGPVARVKGGHDFGSSNFAQHILDRAMAKGLYADHVKTLRDSYRIKRDAILRALEEHMPEGVSWTHPHGGLYVWLTLPETVETGPQSRLFKQATEEGMIYVPGEFCYGPDAALEIPTNHIRLSFGVGDPARLKEGVCRLSSAIRHIISTG